MTDVFRVGYHPSHAMPAVPLTALERDIGAALGDAGVPGCSLAVVGPSGVRWRAAFGHADLGRARPADVGSVYHLFSGTKLFTATAVMQLVEAGALDLEADARRYLPDAPIPAGITIRSLLSHSSGLKETLTGFMAVFFPGDPEPTTARRWRTTRFAAGGRRTRRSSTAT